MRPQVINWTNIQKFIEREIEKGPRQDIKPVAAALQYNSLLLVLQMLLAYLNLLGYLEPPENRGMRRCPWCKDEFEPMYSHTVACSDECDRLWRLYPPNFDKEAHDRIAKEVLEMGTEEKARP